MKVCIVSSCGGHLTEARRLMPAYEAFEYFHIIDDKAILPSDMVGRTYFIAHGERNLKVLLSFWQAWLILRKERPHVILSTGAGVIVPLAIVGRFFFGTRVIFVETITRVKAPSLSGRIMYHLAHRFFYQWESLARFFPKGEYGGPIL